MGWVAVFTVAHSIKERWVVDKPWWVKAHWSPHQLWTEKSEEERAEDYIFKNRDVTLRSTVEPGAKVLGGS